MKVRKAVIDDIDTNVLSNNDNAIQFYKKMVFTDKRKTMFCRV